MSKRVLLLLALCVVACAPRAKHLVILHVNDTHSHFEADRATGQGGVIERAAYIDSVRRAEGRRNVLLLHAGDFNQGTSYYSVIGGSLEVATLNAMRYDAVALGNHEFDNGIEDLAARLAKCRVPVVCANYDFSSFELGKYVKPYTIVRRGGYKIGIIGTLADLTRLVDRNTSDRLPLLDAFEVVNKWAAFLRDEKKCDLVILLSHMGFDPPLTDAELITGTRGVDIVIDGHSHTFLDGIVWATDLDGHEVPIVQDGQWGLEIGRLEVNG